jgi:putative ABC transport system permease protein
VGYAGLDTGGVTVDARALTMADARRVRTIPSKRNISAVAPKLVTFADIIGKRLLVIGTDFRQEHRTKVWWKLRGEFAGASDEVMLGAEASRVLGRGTGDVLTFGSVTRRITAVIGPTGGMDDRAVFADLAVAQDLAGAPEAVSFIEVSALCRECPIEDIVAEIAAVIPHGRVAPIRQAVAAREHAVLQFTRFAYGVSVVVLLVGGLMVTTTMMASVSERTQEIGILRAVGFRQGQVARVILLESLGVTLAGGVLGWFAGTVAATSLGPLLTASALDVAIDPQLAGIAVGLAMVLGAAGGVYPALRAAHMDPSQALRHI